MQRDGEKPIFPILAVFQNISGTTPTRGREASSSGRFNGIHKQIPVGRLRDRCTLAVRFLMLSPVAVDLQAGTESQGQHQKQRSQREDIVAVTNVVGPIGGGRSLRHRRRQACLPALSVVRFDTEYPMPNEIGRDAFAPVEGNLAG